MEKIEVIDLCWCDCQGSEVANISYCPSISWGCPHPAQVPGPYFRPLGHQPLPRNTTTALVSSSLQPCPATGPLSQACPWAQTLAQPQPDPMALCSHPGAEPPHQPWSQHPPAGRCPSRASACPWPHRGESCPGLGLPQLPLSYCAPGWGGGNFAVNGVRNLYIFFMSTYKITHYFFNSIFGITQCIKQTACPFQYLFLFLLFNERN